MPDTAASSTALTPSRWTAPMARTIAVASVLFAIGTGLHNFAVIDATVIEEMMVRAGGVDPASDAPGFTRGFQFVGTIYILANAAGVLAWWRQPAWLFWLVLLVNATQGLGWVTVPPEMWPVLLDRYSVWGILPSVLVDGGGALLAMGLLTSLVIGRHTWARTPRPCERRVPPQIHLDHVPVGSTSIGSTR